MINQPQIATGSPKRAAPYRTDRNNNPTCFSTDVAAQAKFVIGIHYVHGDAFPDDPGLFTAKLLGNPIELTIRVIDALGFVTLLKRPRWSYIILPKFVWDDLFTGMKRDVIGYMYQCEGGTAMISLFPNYGKF
jgi:hypothetical protein